MGKAYSGKEVCQGCGKTGGESWRDSRNSLCDKCKEELRAARQLNRESTCEYIKVKQHRYAFNSLSFDDNTLNKFVIDLLGSLHNPFAIPPNGFVEILPNSGNLQCDFIIPTKTFDAVKDFVLKMNDFVRDIREKKEKIPYQAAKAVQAEKDRIYNEGIAKGRNLLVQLNTGNIIIEQFNAVYDYKEKKEQ